MSTCHIAAHFGDNFMVRRPNHQCHSTEGQRLVNQVKGQSLQAQLVKRYSTECNQKCRYI